MSTGAEPVPVKVTVKGMDGATAVLEVHEGTTVCEVKDLANDRRGECCRDGSAY